MSYGLQLLGNARSVRGDQFRRPEFERQGQGSVRIVSNPEVGQNVVMGNEARLWCAGRKNEIKNVGPIRVQ